jgi:hypothetical protein
MTQAVQTYADAAARTTANPSPTEGQLIYLNDINQFQGSHGGSVWYPIGGVMPFIHYAHTTSQSLTTGNEVNVNAWAQQSFKGMVAATDFFSLSSGTITVARAGTYRIEAQANFSTGATGIRSLSLTAGGINYGRVVAPAYTLTGQTLVQFSQLVELAANDSITLAVAQTNGSSLTLTSNTRIKISYVGA